MSALVSAGSVRPVAARATGSSLRRRLRGTSDCRALCPSPCSTKRVIRSFNLMPSSMALAFARRNSSSGRSIVILIPAYLCFVRNRQEGVTRLAVRQTGGGSNCLPSSLMLCRSPPALWYHRFGLRGSRMLYKLPLLLSPQPEGGFMVTSPLLPELVTEGDTVSEALAMPRMPWRPSSRPTRTSDDCCLPALPVAGRRQPRLAGNPDRRLRTV